MPINSFLYPSKNVPVAYDVANSCRFDGSSAYMHKTPSSEGNKQTFTFSTWVKRSLLGVTTAVDQHLISADAGNTETYIFFLANSGSGATSANTDCLNVYSTDSAGNVEMALRTTPLYRDVASWMHVCVAIDTTQGTDTNRVKIYVNGTQITSFSLATYPAQNENLAICDDVIHEIARRPAGTTKYFNGYLAETVLIDGQQLAPTSFGEFDSDSPNIWKPIDVSGLTAGTNGFYLDYEDSSNLGNDVFGGTDLTEVNLAATDQSTDTCTNNFCTLNPLGFTEGTLSEGNLEIDQNGSAGRFCASTFQVTQGKWYFEAKLLNYGSDPRPSIGVGRNEETFTGNASAGASSIVYGLENTSVFKGNTDVFTYDSSPSSGDIYGVAFDLDNLKIYFHKNGDYANSGNPGNGTGNVTTLVSGTDYSPITGALNTNSNSARNNDWQFNFGSPIHSITSGNSDANGFGNFEYQVPPGFFSLCSKNLAEFG